jgi:hypothetical protein
MPNKPNPNNISKVERDPRLFMWFMTLVIAGISVVAWKDSPSLQEPQTLILFASLITFHIILHWQLEKIARHPNRILWYTISQGILALAISSLGNNIGLTSALFMALIGETVGLFGLTRQGLLATVFFMLLLAINLVQISGWDSSGSFLLGSIPMVVFVVIYVTLYMRRRLKT